MKGILYGIGVGPGDPELLTMKALSRMKACEIIILPAAHITDCYAYNIVKEIYPEITTKKLLCMEFPMVKEKEKLEEAHEQIFIKIRDLLQNGDSAAFLTIGDPTIYSTYMYIHKRMIKEGIEAHIINGIPSFCAAAAVMGISLGEKKEEIHIIPASYEVEEALHLKGTKIFMKSGKQLLKLKEVLKKSSIVENSSVYAISNCGMKNEIIYSSMEEISQESGYLTIVIVKDKEK